MPLLPPIKRITDDGFRLKYIITGTGYCGTGYTARLLCSLDIPCGHEHFFDTVGPQTQEMLGVHETKTHLLYTGATTPSSEGVADSSRYAARHLDHPMCHDAAIIHLVRDPVLVFRAHLHDHYDLDYACNWWVDINLMIEKYRNEERYHRVRINDCPQAILDIVGHSDATDFFRPEALQDATERARAYNSKWGALAEKGVEELTWKALRTTPAVERMRRMAKRYGVGQKTTISNPFP